MTAWAGIFYINKSGQVNWCHLHVIQIPYCNCDVVVLFIDIVSSPPRLKEVMIFERVTLTCADEKTLNSTHRVSGKVGQDTDRTLHDSMTRWT